MQPVGTGPSTRVVHLDPSHVLEPLGVLSLLDVQGLRTYVVNAGLLYGCGEGDLMHSFFQVAQLGCLGIYSLGACAYGAWRMHTVHVECRGMEGAHQVRVHGRMHGQ